MSSSIWNRARQFAPEDSCQMSVFYNHGIGALADDNGRPKATTMTQGSLMRVGKVKEKIISNVQVDEL